MSDFTVLKEAKLKELDDALHDELFNGVFTVYEDNHAVIEIANGYKDYANKLKHDVNTRFGTASGTKLFTALGILKLVEKGLLNLDDFVYQYVSEYFRTYARNVTIRHLLAHTSGIPDYLDEEKINDFGDFYVDKPWYVFLKPSDYIDIMPNKPLLFQPGSSFKYNNSAFVWLSIIIEKLTGDYHQYIKHEIFDKANMTNSGSFRLDALPKNTAIGYKNIKKHQSNVYSLPIIAGGDGGMFTTAKDMHLFWRALFEEKIISKPLLEEMLTPQFQTEGLLPGLGVWLEKYEDSYMPLTIGEDCGVSFESGHNPFKNITYTVLSNTQDGAWPVVKAYKLLRE